MPASLPAASGRQVTADQGGNYISAASGSGRECSGHLVLPDCLKAATLQALLPVVLRDWRGFFFLL
jgi:hypothetical protein